MPKRRQLRAFDLKRIETHASLLGVDEAGRGALAGPVVAGAVLVTREFLDGRWAVTRAGRVNDSKLLTAAEREELWQEFEALAAAGQIHAHFGVASVEEIERFNILGATKLAMRRALEGIYPPSAFERKTEPDLFSSLEERTAFPADGLLPRPDRRPGAAPVSLSPRGDRERRCPLALHRHGLDRGEGEPGPADAGVGRARFPATALRSTRATAPTSTARRCCGWAEAAEHRDLFLRKLLAGRVDPAQMDFLAEAGPGTALP